MTDVSIGSGRFMLGDCLERMAELPDASVDMILCDLPYGTTQNKWDEIIPLDPLWAQYWRVAKPEAAVVLTAAQPFTSALVMSQMAAFKYPWVWEKSRPVGHLDANRKPLRLHEDILVFCKQRPPYNPQGLIPTGGKIRKARSTNGSNYGAAQKDSVSEWTGYPTSVLICPSEDNRNSHPTQKPVALFEYMIRTYTDEGMTVLDNCAGSGTTAIAAERAGRKWICIEREPKYFDIACKRIEDAQRQGDMFI